MFLTTNTGVSGSQHRVCMILNQYETSSGGPFHRYGTFSVIAMSDEMLSPSFLGTLTPIMSAITLASTGT